MMITLVDVLDVAALDGTRLWLRFSDGLAGVRDLADVLREGGTMVEPLRDPALFRRVFVSLGAPAWPNGYDLDPIQLHREMSDAGALRAA